MPESCINRTMSISESIEEQMKEGGISPYSEDSREWFMKNVDAIKEGISRNRVMKTMGKQTARIYPGMMYMFFYNPKGRKTLPYYDAFPLILLVDTHNDGMTGLNLHYLPIHLRQKLFYGLLNRVSNKKMNERTYIKMTYEYLKATKAVKEFKPCFKKYLTSQINGSISKIPAEEWETAVHLPLAMFKKKAESTVHRESEKIIQRF